MASGGAIGVTALLILLIEPLVATGAEPPSGASSCSGCHAASAAVQTPVPRLAGRPRTLRDFRGGQRPATVMDRIAQGFSDGETVAIAEWYAGQQP